MKGVIKKFSGKETGFLIFECKPGCYLNILIGFNISFFAKAFKYRKHTGVYIPAVFNQEIKNNEIDFEVKDVEGIPIKFGFDGRFYIPQEFIQTKKLNYVDLANFKFLFEDKTPEFLLRLCKRKKKNTNNFEYYSFLNKSYSGKKGILLDINHIGSGELKNIISRGKKPMVYTRPNLDREFAYYLGCYFSDGTKKRTWGICASTLEQARFYFKMHNRIIPTPKIRFTLSYTPLSNETWEENEIKKQWSDIPISKVYFRRGLSDFANKRNLFGTLIMKENGIGVLLAYKNILSECITELLKARDSNLAISFIGGVMEGDGGSNATKRGHVQIATNREDYKTLEKILKVAKLKSKTTWEGENRYHIRIGTEELTKNLDRLNLFLLYPKRRKVLIRRLSNTGIWRALFSNTYSAKALYLIKRMGLLSKNEKKLTEKGIKIRNLIFDMVQEVKSVTIK